MKRILIISCTLFPLLGFGQYFGPEVVDSIIVKNNVSKCTEYNIEDSTEFFSEYPNGFYWIYNKRGLTAQNNAYSVGYLPHEFTVHFIYDNQGRNIMWLWQDTTWTGNIARIRIEEYDSLGNNYGYRDFSVAEEYSAAYEVKNYTKTYNTIEIVDSIVLINKKEYHHFLN